MGDGPARPIALLSGKGGVGKTTLATALARRSAGSGARTLLVSTDPAHSTGDLLGTRLGDEPQVVASGLWAVEIDAEAAADAYVARVRRDARDAVSREVLPAVDRHLELARRSAGTLEAALLDRLLDHLDGWPERFDRIVVDTAPTGHTLRLLAMPQLLTVWVEGLVRQRERTAVVDRWARNLTGRNDPRQDPLIARLRARRDRFARGRRRLVDHAVVHLVLTPERLPIEETARARDTLAAAGLTVGTVLVNRVVPDDADGRYIAQRRDQQRLYLQEIDRRFGDLPRRRIPQLPRDVTGADDLAAVGAHLAALLEAR